MNKPIGDRGLVTYETYKEIQLKDSEIDMNVPAGPTLIHDGPIDIGVLEGSGTISMLGSLT